MSGLSPVARIESPSLVFKKKEITIPANTTMPAATINLYQVPPMLSFAQVKMDLQLNKLTLEANPMTAMLIVYNPVFTIIPARIDWIPIFVCKNAVTNPEHIPAAIAASSASTGCPANVTVAQTAQPKVKHPSVDKSAIFKIENEINNANATNA